MSTLRLIRDGRIVDNDVQTLAADHPLPATGRVLVDLARWRQQAGALRAASCEVGVILPNTEDVLALWPEIGDRTLLAVEFPKWADGRAFSQARLLRERLGFRGELRAVGDVARDQLQFMQRCGINAFELRADQDPQRCLEALHDFDLAYQRAADSLDTIWARRRAAG
jgi:uncharacterized protein (DUF934 family)